MKWFDFLNFKIFSEFDPLIEGPMAHEIADENLRQHIQQRYDELYNKAPNPHTHPELYNPLVPPQGWAWDPHYECWITTHDSR